MKRIRSTHFRRRLALLGLAALTIAIAAAMSTLDASAAAAQSEVASTPTHVYPNASWERIADTEAAGYSSARLDSLRSYVDTLNTTSLMVVVGGRVLFEYGDITRRSYLASVRKSILAMLYGNYVADGTIRLDKTLRQLGMDDHGGLLPSEQEATIEHLITARSGIYHVASNSGDNSAEAPDRGSQPPGTYFLYNNWDFNAAGAAFERETGVDIYDALESDIARPIGMQDFHRTQQRKSGNLERSKYPAYHMWLSTRDMTRVGYLMLRGGTWEAQQVIPHAWASKITSVVTPVEEMNPPRMRQNDFGYGYMWWAWDGPNAVGPYEGAYTGRGAYGQYITVLPALNMVIAHKTVPRATVPWTSYSGIIERLIAARCETTCD